MKINTDSADGRFEDINTDEENPHDQLPSPDEYKANMQGGQTSTMRDNPQDGNDEHDLPTVDEYKSNMSFRDQEERPKSRAGLWTFLCLLLLLIIITAIAVPLALRGKAKKSPDASSGGSTFTGSNTGDIITSSPVFRPTRPPTRPPTAYDLPRKDLGKKYLTDFGIADPAALADPLSPQAKALEWIANEDEFKIEIPNPLEGVSGKSYADSRFTERWSLAVFYYSTGGDAWRYRLKFMQPIDHCDWFDRFVDPRGTIIRQGVTECKKSEEYPESGDKVTRIEISNNNMIGNVPTEIENFSYLETWITPFNAELTTTSSLDPFIKLAGSLTHLELQYCKIAGAIPDTMGSMSSLSFLGLGNNLLTGSIPDSFFGLSELVVLGLDDNLLESDIANFAKFTKMQKMYIEDNLIIGEITEAVVNGWQEMVDLDASVNRLVGSLPANLFSMSSLEVIDVHGNDFIGKIPAVGGVHENMFFFAVQDNSLTGNLPESVNNLVNLKHLDITANKMTLPFPSTMGQLTNLVSLYTGINGFTDHPVPEFLTNMTGLRELSMKQNSLTGEIPAYLGGMTELQVLDLDFNKLNGTIPEELGQLFQVDTLMLNRNFLTGTIPTSFFGLIDLDVLLLDGNELTGDATIVCNNPAVNTTAFSADCGGETPEISCSCCTICCQDSDPDCNNLDWRINLDGIWEYDFQRVVYSFSQEVLPSEAKQDYVDNDDRRL